MFNKSVHKGHEEIQNENFYFILSKELWKGVFKKVYDECGACVTPHIEMNHTCILLWNEYQLKENLWADRFINKYYDIVFLELNWNAINVLCNNSFNSKCQYWQTRQRKLKLKSAVKQYMQAAAIGEAYAVLKAKLDLLETKYKYVLVKLESH